MSLSNVNIVLGVTGGIAAYKAIELVSRLRKAGAAVKVIMTQAAAKFVTPLTFREISGNPVVVDMWSEAPAWNVEHIALARWAELFVIAPATANIIGKMAHGIADDMLSTTVLATQAKLVVAPAMNSNMFANAAVQANIAALVARGAHLIEPASGWLACGDEGQGRLPEPAEIFDILLGLSRQTTLLRGKKVLVTAGGTREPLDPVRYIGNRSSGKMGYAIAQAAAMRGADVVLVSGPSKLDTPSGVRIIRVETASEMRQAVLNEYEDCSIVIKAAAVADYRPQVVAEQKIKKTDGGLTIVLEKNPDILWELGQLKKKQFLVGFAAETQELLANAMQKMQKKKLDMIVANDVSQQGAGFDADTNIIKMVEPNGSVTELPKLSKKELAERILDKICVNLDIMA